MTKNEFYEFAKRNDCRCVQSSYSLVPRTKSKDIYEIIAPKNLIFSFTTTESFWLYGEDWDFAFKVIHDYGFSKIETISISPKE